MERISVPAAVIAVACAAALGAAPAGAVEGDPSAAAATPSAKVKGCSRGGSAGRYAVFVGEMPATEDAARLQMRFDLFSRPDIGGEWQPVSGVPSFGKWKAADPGAGGLKVKKKVFLNRGKAYRVVVRYRWLGPDGQVLRSAVRISGSCVQPDPRPDLGIIASAQAGAIVVVVGNLGREAGPFEVRLSSGGREVASEAVAGLGAGESRSLVFDGLSCEAGSTVKVAVDPENVIRERRASNNVVELMCPVSG